MLNRTVVRCTSVRIGGMYFSKPHTIKTSNVNIAVRYCDSVGNFACVAFRAEHKTRSEKSWNIRCHIASFIVRVATLLCAQNKHEKSLRILHAEKREQKKRLSVQHWRMANTKKLDKVNTHVGFSVRDLRNKMYARSNAAH